MEIHGNEICIYITGYSATGKSAIAEVINQCLTNLGINVELIDDNGNGVVDERPGAITPSLIPRLSSVIDDGRKVERS